MSGLVAYLDAGELDEVLENNDMPILLEFYTEQCAHCKTMSSVLASFAEKYRNEYLVCAVDANRAQGAVERFGVRSVPTLIAFQNGKVLGFAVGVRTEAQILAMFGETANV